MLNLLAYRTQMVNWLHSQASKLTPTQVTIGLPCLSVGCQTRQTLLFSPEIVMAHTECLVINRTCRFFSYFTKRISSDKPRLVAVTNRQYTVELLEHYHILWWHQQDWVRRHHSQKRQALHNLYLILSWRLLHWPNIKPTSAERLLSLEKQIMVLIKNEMNRALGHLCAHIG